MATAALLSPETWPLPDSVDREVLARLSVELRGLLDDVRRARPPEGSAEETAALMRMRSFCWSSVRALDAEFLQVFRSGVNEALGDLVRKELAAAEPTRKLALRHIEQAVHSFGVLLEKFGAVFRELPASSLGKLLDGLAEGDMRADVALEEEERLVLRFQLSVMVALDVLDAAVDELTHWAFRVLTEARQVDALPVPRQPIGLLGELARVRARRSWDAWDADEIARELAPWPSPSR